MDEFRLNEDLEALAKRPVPDLPTDFRCNGLVKGPKPRDAVSCAPGELA
jgi:hypothetical protein